MQELKDLAEGLTVIVMAGLGERSKFALRTLIDAHSTEGIAGVCVLKIPPRQKDRVDVSFTVGDVDVIQRWGVAN